MTEQLRWRVRKSPRRWSIFPWWDSRGPYSHGAFRTVQDAWAYIDKKVNQ